jgi:hypothetical protein
MHSGWPMCDTPIRSGAEQPCRSETTLTGVPVMAILSNSEGTGKLDHAGYCPSRGRMRQEEQDPHGAIAPCWSTKKLSHELRELREKKTTTKHVNDKETNCAKTTKRQLSSLRENSKEACSFFAVFASELFLVVSFDSGFSSRNSRNSWRSFFVN